MRDPPPPAARELRQEFAVSCASLRGNDEMCPAVLRVRRLVVSGIEGELLPVADDAQAVAGDAERDEIRTRRCGAPLAQRQIVLGGPAFIAVSFDRDGPAGVALEHAGVLVEHALPIATEVAAIELEKDRLQRRVAIEIVERRR